MHSVRGKSRLVAITKKQGGPIASWRSVRNHVQVPGLRPHTKTYPAEARERLGTAVSRARERAGHPHRPSFLPVAKIGITSLVKLESGQPVGPVVYEAVARALPGWTEDTPILILEGGPVPAATEEEYGHGLPGEPSLDANAEAVRINEIGDLLADPDLIGTDEWLEKITDALDPKDIPEMVRLGLEARRKRRELEEVRRRIAERVQSELRQ